jgi:fucose 4-O-acetylase-like acetyltransferase
LPQRDSLIDVGKGAAIALMVLGHVIQCTAMNLDEFWNHPMVQIIYAFHMPLFMFLSGVVVGYSRKKNIATVIKAKSRSLAIPYITWTITIYVTQVAVAYFITEVDLPSLLAAVKGLVGGTRMWYLWVLFILSVITPFTEGLTKKIGPILAGFLTCVILFILPIHHGQIYQVKWLSPFYFVGFFVGRYRGNIAAPSWLLRSLTCCFLILLPFLQVSDFIYINLFSGSLGRMLFRYALAFSGIGAFVYAISALKHGFLRKQFETLGLYSLDIYALQSILVLFIDILRRPANALAWNFGFIPVLTIFVLVSSVLISKYALRRSQFLSVVFLGSQLDRKAVNATRTYSAT